jgi:uncharacterized protein
MVKPVGPVCNLACDYCYYLSKEKLFPGSEFIMTEALLEDFTRQYIQSQHVPQISFLWQGGEPLLAGLDLFHKALALQRQYARPGMKIENAIQTNGTLLTDEWCSFFKENNFLVGLSIDGPPELHNVYRKDRAGGGSAERVLAGLALLKKHEVDYNVLCTVHDANVHHPLEVYRYLRDDLETTFVQFIPIVERDNKTGYQVGNKVTSRSVSGEQYGRFLIEIFDEWVEHDVGEVFVQIFDVALGKWVGAQGGLCIFSQTCGLALLLEHNGDLFSCDHFVEPKHKLGNLSKAALIDLVQSHHQYRFGMDKWDKLPKYCRECEVLFACHGGCPKNRILHTPDGEFGLNILCEGYQAFFNHIDQPMRQMAALLKQHRPAAEIMLHNK